MLLQAENTSAIVIDVQERLMPVMSDKEVLEKNICTLIRGLKTLDIPMVVTQQYTKGIGMTIPSVREALESDDYFDKKSFSCYGDPAVKEAVDKLGRKEVLVFGIEAHICVLQTCLELAENGYTPILVTDCVSSRRLSDKETGIRRAIQEGIRVTTCESVLFELIRGAYHPDFKVISKLIK